MGVYKPSDPRKYFLPLPGLACPVTAILDFRPSGTVGAGTRDVTLILYDPTRRSAVQLAGAQRPLAADFGAPLAYYPEPGLLLGLMAMMRPENYEQRTGLYMLEPYDPDRIPVIFVHGLLSIPQMWVPTVTGVESDPALRGRYQFWVFAYPTGDPIALSALRLRESLAQVYQLYPKTKDVVLISHSMGGLLSQMQAVTTRHVLWDRVFRGYADQVYAALPPDNVVKRALIFDANPRVARIVFICVPHRGSDLAINWIGSIGIALIRLPGKILTGVTDVVAAPLQKSLGLGGWRAQRPFAAESSSSRTRHSPSGRPITRSSVTTAERYTQQLGRRCGLLSSLTLPPVGISHYWSARFFCSLRPSELNEPTPAFGSRALPPRTRNKKSTVGFDGAEQKVNARNDDCRRMTAPEMCHSRPVQEQSLRSTNAPATLEFKRSRISRTAGEEVRIPNRNVWFIETHQADCGKRRQYQRSSQDRI